MQIIAIAIIKTAIVITGIAADTGIGIDPAVVTPSGSSVIAVFVVITRVAYATAFTGIGRLATVHTEATITIIITRIANIAFNANTSRSLAVITGTIAIILARDT